MLFNSKGSMGSDSVGSIFFYSRVFVFSISLINEEFELKKASVDDTADGCTDWDYYSHGYDGLN